MCIKLEKKEHIEILLVFRTREGYIELRELLFLTILNCFITCTH